MTAFSSKAILVHRLCGTGDYSNRIMQTLSVIIYTIGLCMIEVETLRDNLFINILDKKEVS